MIKTFFNSCKIFTSLVQVAKPSLNVVIVPLNSTNSLVHIYFKRSHKAHSAMFIKIYYFKTLLNIIEFNGLVKEHVSPLSVSGHYNLNLEPNFIIYILRSMHAHTNCILYVFLA